MKETSNKALKVNIKIKTRSSQPVASGKNDAE